VSIVRVGLAETKKFAEGYDAIFGKKKDLAEKPKKKRASTQRSATKHKRALRKKQ
jgi:hypothetical protein